MWSASSPNLSIGDTRLANLNTFSVVLLGIFTITALIANVCLILAVVSSYSLRHTVFYYHVLHFAVVNLIHTCIGNFIKMIYIGSGQWIVGHFLCTFDAFLGQLLMIQALYAVTLLSIDRAIAMISIYRYECRMTKLRTSMAIAGCWIISFSMTIPILVDGIKSEPIAPRFLCGVIRPPVGYPLAVLFICFVVPLFAILWALGVVLWKIHMERIKPRLPNRDGSNTADFIIIVRMAQEQLDLSKYCVIIFCLYYLMQGPYFVFVFVVQIRNSQELEHDTGSVMETPPDIETCLTLLYGLYIVVCPLVTICYVKEIWKKIKTWLCCRRNNFILDVTTFYDMKLLIPGTNPNRNQLTNPDGTLKTLKTYENIVKIVPLSAGIHQIRPGHDEPEYADVPAGRHAFVDFDDAKNRNDAIVSSGTSDYGSNGSMNLDELGQKRCSSGNGLVEKMEHGRNVANVDVHATAESETILDVTQTETRNPSGSCNRDHEPSNKSCGLDNDCSVATVVIDNDTNRVDLRSR